MIPSSKDSTRALLGKQCDGYGFLMSKLQSLRLNQKETKERGDFLFRVRHRVSQTGWIKAKAHWFEVKKAMVDLTAVGLESFAAEKAPAYAVSRSRMYQSADTVHFA